MPEATTKPINIVVALQGRPAGSSTGALLLEDGTSFLLQEDGLSLLLLE